jgi:amino acid transporter
MVLGDAPPLHVTAFTVTVLWLVVLANAWGLRVSKWVSNAGGTLTYLGGAVVLGASVAVALRFGSATSFAVRPSFNIENVGLWAQIALAYTGLELGSLVTGSVRDPARTVPRAVWISAAAVASAYILGSASLMLVLPPEKIHPMTGLIGVATEAGSRLGFAGLGQLAAGFLFAGIVGKLSTWSTGAAHIPALLGVTRLRTALTLQGVVCTAFLLITQAGETVRAGWQTLTDMAVLTGVAPFVYIFLAAWRFRLRVSAACGLGVTLVAIVLSFVPPPGASSTALFLTKLTVGCIVSTLTGIWFYERRRITDLQSISEQHDDGAANGG